MSDDLVKQLRSMQVFYTDGRKDGHVAHAAAYRIEELEQEVERSRVLAAEYIALAEMAGGCGDGYCVVFRPKGMQTNGGCKCTHDMDRARERSIARLLLKAQTLSRTVLLEGARDD